MTRPVHVDVAKMRAAHAVANAAAIAGARARAKSPAAQLGIDLQERFLVLMVEASCIAAQARNDGFDELAVGKSLGHVLGMISGNYLANATRSGNLAAGMIHHDAMLTMIEAASTGIENVPGMASSSMSYSATEGGTA